MPKGLLIYGFDKKDANVIYESMNQQVQSSLFLKSAHGKESETVETILESSYDNDFKNKKTKIIMFVNIKNSDIQQMLQTFPNTVERPIFCGLTKHNINWPFTELKNHLLEEQAHLKQQRSQK